MKVIILCGGNGTRMQDYSFPKPLNLIHGKPAISYCLQNLPDSIHELHFITAPHLYEYNIEEVIINQFKQRTCIFHRLPYFTRGPIESAWLGTQSLICNEEEPILFLDNDVLYRFPVNLFDHNGSAFLGYAHDSSGSCAYSYVTIVNDHVIDIVEKKRISNEFCCGAYGFSSLIQFRQYAEPIIHLSTKELYMSMIYAAMIRDQIPIAAFDFGSHILHIGSLSELQKSWDNLSRPMMRVCFDLDNTLVTYPTIPGDYRTVRPILAMIELLRKMKSEGHTIIIYTARRMATHSHNVGAVIRDIGKITLDTLDQFNIPYDELLFGKPIADMYIDDRAVNPYRRDLQSIGYMYSPTERPQNALPTNKYNQIRMEDGIVIKTSPSHMSDGECYYYHHLPPSLVTYFPRFIKTIHHGATTDLYLESISHIPFASLYQSELLNEGHLDMLFEIIHTLHHTPATCVDNPLPTHAHIKALYVDKLQKRFAESSDYPFFNASAYQRECIARIEEYLLSPVHIVPYIHGDLWFSNILLTYQHELKLIDMRGKVPDLLTTGGDVVYDYAKVYQSILGYDCVLYGTSVSTEYADCLKQYVDKLLIKYGQSIDKIRDVSLSLMMGTMHSITAGDTKERVWNWLTCLYDRTRCHSNDLNESTSHRK